MISNEPDFEPAPDDAAGPRLPRPVALRPDLQDPADWPQPAPAAGLGAGAVLHGLRRRWLLAFAVGLLCSAAAATAAWFALEPKYVATAYLQLHSRQQKYVDTGRVTNDFDLFKRTQREIILNPFVLTAALRGDGDSKNGTLRNNPLLRNQEDPASWLARELVVDYPGNAEILRISLKGDHPKALADIVNAVAAAYLTEVAHSLKETEQLNELRKVWEKAHQDVVEKRRTFRDQAARVGAPLSPTAELTTAARERHQQLLAQLSDLKDQQRLADVEVKSAQALVDAIPDDPSSLEVPQADLDNLVNTQDHVIGLRSQLAGDEDFLAETRRVAAPDKANLIKAAESKVESAAQQLKRAQDAARENLRPQLALQIAAQRRQHLAEKQASLDLINGQIAHLDADLIALAAELQTDAAGIGELQQIGDELEPLQQIAATLGTNHAMAQVELKAPKRVELFQSATPPSFRDDKSQRQSTAAIAVFAFFLPIFGIAWLDARSRRVNCSAEINHFLGMRVIGSLPMLPAPSRRLLGRVESRGAQWRVALRESIDGVRTMLLRETDLEPTRLLLVTSAVSGEGKTSLATQLAVSFARAQCRTLLVDFDLRRPAAHQVFRLPLDPGVCDILRGDASLPDCIQPTGAANLSFLAAGLCDEAALASLAQPAVARLFDQLRADYDFVIVDCSPILPVVDSLLIGRHVDAALFSVLRDVSQSHKIQAAHDRLTALGVRVLGTVVTGKDEVAFRPDYRYQGQA